MYRTIVEIIKHTFDHYSDKLAYSWREKKVFHSLTYGEVEKHVYALSTALIDMGLKFGQSVGLIADVSHYWAIGNLSIEFIGAVDVPRGTDSTEDELGFILTHSGAEFVLVHNAAQIDKIEKGIKKHKGKIKQYIVLDDKIPEGTSKKAESLKNVLKRGQDIIAKKGRSYKEIEKRQKKIKSDSLASIIYTSGTTGNPKGVMLTHGNFVSQINLVPGPFNLSVGDRALTLLPPWHVFGRILEYMFFEAGMEIHYTDVRHLGEDLKNIKPHFVPAVPRIWEGVYNKIMGGIKSAGAGKSINIKEKIFLFFKTISLLHFRAMKIIEMQDRRFAHRSPLVDLPLKTANFLFVGLLWPLKLLGHLLVFRKIIAATGGQLRASISGGGALPDYIDEFFAAAGIRICEGYGLTETSPVLSVRHPDRIVLGTVGPAVPATELRVIDMEGKDVTHMPGDKGTLYVRGPQVMKGYYRSLKKTAEVMDDDGWFNTGDLVKITIDGDISIVGRSKDTIVLRGGENVEPTPVEERLKKSPYVDNVMLVGQDEKNLGALIVPAAEELEEYVKQNNIPGDSIEDWVENQQVQKFYRSEVQRLVNGSTGFRPFERVSHLRLLKKPFEMGDEINRTFKLRRFVVTERYAELIKSMYQ
ncbi:MAG: AMP-binding protein [Leptospirales bacterium]